MRDRLSLKMWWMSHIGEIPSVFLTCQKSPQSGHKDAVRQSQSWVLVMVSHKEAESTTQREGCSECSLLLFFVILSNVTFSVEERRSSSTFFFLCLLPTSKLDLMLVGVVSCGRALPVATKISQAFSGSHGSLFIINYLRGHVWDSVPCYKPDFIPCSLLLSCAGPILRRTHSFVVPPTPSFI